MKKFVSVIMVVVLAILLALGVLGGILAVEADAAQDYELKIYEDDRFTPYLRTYLIIDDVTGVNYIAGRFGDSFSITPRLNADGSLYVSK